MKKRHLTLSFILHTILILFFILISSSIMKKDDSTILDAVTVSISGNPNLKIGTPSRKGSLTPKSKMLMSNAGSAYKNIETNFGGNSESFGEGGGTGYLHKTNYFGLVLKKIQERKYYPVEAKRKNLSGAVKVSFTLNKDGSLKNKPIVLESSSQQLLDDTAIKIVESSAPFPYFTNEFDKKEIDFNIIIDFAY